jgi:primosomal protein N' (replication factor Y)
METKFVDVILPLPVPRPYTYRVPKDWNEKVCEGARVLVQFGKKKIYTAIIYKVHHTPPQHYRAKYLSDLVDEFPIVQPKQIELWRWIADYYMCSLGEVMAAAMPAGLKVSSETIIMLNHHMEIDFDQLTDREYLIAEALESNEKLTMQEVSDILQLKTVYPIVQGLIAKQIILIEEVVKERYKPKMNDFATLSPNYQSEGQLKQAFDELSNAPKQMHVLMKLLQLGKTPPEKVDAVKKTTLQKEAQASSAQVKALAEKGIIEIESLEVGRLPSYQSEPGEKQLNEEQQAALESIEAQFEESRKPVLLQGVTGSGKTELYIKLIQKTLDSGRQALYLLPEIALTTQIISRLEKHFGDQILVYHSKFNAQERVEIWQKLLKTEQPKLILGARSAIFLPMNNLGLTIVDEEHEQSFKQYDPAPRYNARDTAVVLSAMHKANMLLGSATPSIESRFNAHSGKYGYAFMGSRHGNAQMPDMEVVDLREQYRKKKMKTHFGEPLYEAVKKALSNGEQVILFQNRRGFSPFVQCNTCGWTPECKNCDVTLTYHKFLKKLKCHYCGYSIPHPKTCPACGSPEVQLKGFGTEKIESDIEIYFPEARIKRMDLDSTRGKNAHQQIINELETGEIDILVGTQMITKGLDFEKVSVVGILNADLMLNFQDFRAHERAFQLMTQVAGRAGRKDRRGKVFIQTFDPDHPVIKQVKKHNYDAMYNVQDHERINFHYPPYYRLIKLTVVHRDKDLVLNGSNELAGMLRRILGDRILGPEYPAVARIKNKYHRQILIKLEKQLHLGKTKEQIASLLTDFNQIDNFKSVRVIVDVDPV